MFWAGSCDDGCVELARLLGWDDELKRLVADEHQRLEAAEATKTDVAAAAAAAAEGPKS